MRKLMTFILVTLLLSAIPVLAQWIGTMGQIIVHLGDVTADDAWVAGKNVAVYGEVLIDSMGFICEGYDGTTGDYAAVGDSTVFFTLQFITFGDDTETVATYESYLDTLTAATEWVEMTINAGHDTLKYGDIGFFEYLETDTTSGVLAIRQAVVTMKYYIIH